MPGPDMSERRPQAAMTAQAVGPRPDRQVPRWSQHPPVAPTHVPQLPAVAHPVAQRLLPVPWAVVEAVVAAEHVPAVVGEAVAVAEHVPAVVGEPPPAVVVAAAEHVQAAVARTAKRTAT